MTERVGFAALGGHIVTQNRTFLSIITNLKDGDYEFFGLEDGFKAFHTGRLVKVDENVFYDNFGRIIPGSYPGSSRYSLTDPDTGEVIQSEIAKAVDFVRAARLDYIVGSGGDDHGWQLKILSDAFRDASIGCKVLVANKTMDGDIGGRDGEFVKGYRAPYTDTSNGYASAVALISNKILQLLPDAWTNNVPVIVTHFGEKSNFVAYGAGWFALMDLVFGGELPEESPGWGLDFMVERIRREQSENERHYGRKFALIDVPESARIEGINHFSEKIKDPHGHRKYHPEMLAIALKEKLKERGLDVHTITYTYDLRSAIQPDFPYPLQKDFEIATETGRVIAGAIREGKGDLESTIKFVEAGIRIGLAPIELVTQKRLTYYSQYPWFDGDTLRVRPEFGRYYEPLLGPRVEREKFLPRKPMVINVFEPMQDKADKEVVRYQPQSIHL